MNEEESFFHLFLLAPIPALLILILPFPADLLLGIGSLIIIFSYVKYILKNRD